MCRTLLTILLVFSGIAFGAPSCPTDSTLNPTGSLGQAADSSYWTGCLRNVLNGTQSIVYNPTNPAPWEFGYIAWEVTPHLDQSNQTFFKYHYIIEVPQKGISHTILGLSGPVEDDSGNIVVPGLTICGNGGPNQNCIWDLTTVGFTSEVKTFKPTDSGNSNPGLPGEIYGVKFDTTIDDQDEDTLKYDISYNSYRIPVWQNFYAKDGVTNLSSTGPGKPTQADVYMYNAGFADSARPYFIVGADTTIFDAPVPEPGFYGVLAGGLAGLYFYVRRRQTA